MSNKKQLSMYIQIVLSLSFPLLTLVLYCLGYTVSLFSYIAFSVILALIFLAYLRIFKNKEVAKLLAFLPLFSLINLAVYVYKSKSVVVIVCMGICFICSAVIAEKACCSSKTKILSVLISTALSVPVLVLSFAFSAFGNFGVNTVVDTIYSPNKTYYAEIIDSDQGALGGDTVVYVHKTDKLNLLIMTVSKTPQRVYLGEWKEYESMQIQWESEQCLVINSKEYHIEI